MSAGIVFQQMLIIFILMMTGYILYRTGVIKDSVTPGISAIVVNVCSPALFLHSSLDRDPNITNQNMLWALIGGAAVYAVLFASAVIIPGLLRIEKQWKNHYALMCVFGNTGFIGIPLITAVLGEKALIYIVVINAYYNLFFYTYGYYMIGGDDRGFQFKKLINVGNIALVLAVLIFLFQPGVPAVVERSLSYMGNATIYLALLVIGVSLAKCDLKKLFLQKKMYVFIAVRFILVPILMAMLLRIFIKDEMLYGTLVLLSAVPVGNLPFMRVEEVGGDGTVLAQGTVLSTVLALLTIPIVTVFM